MSEESLESMLLSGKGGITLEEALELRRTQLDAEREEEHHDKEQAKIHGFDA